MLVCVADDRPVVNFVFFYFNLSPYLAMETMKSTSSPPSIARESIEQGSSNISFTKLYEGLKEPPSTVITPPSSGSVAPPSASQYWSLKHLKF
ncbi:hypothetical protein HID58_074324 [Brassica napus]|uniref:Uncharacterized protein n=1 Tax=Brassica napus TaxID=3708 RepID=A0ABQ7YGK7_BRANA|nr:hypothetical protein HID58_074324 [Brassica napus]